MTRAQKKRAVHILARPFARVKGRDTMAHVMSELERASRENVSQPDRIVEQLKQCPEAFQVGEMLPNVLDKMKRDPDQTAHQDSCRAPAGAVVPPLV
jgi:hypothetical protein